MITVLKLIHTFLDLLFPKNCFGCGEKGVIICEKCLKNIPFPDDDGPAFILAACSYKSAAVQKAIRALKYKKAKTAAGPLSELIFRRLKNRMIDEGLTTAVIIPVPLSKKRLRERGFNQSELIAKNLSEKLSGLGINAPVYSNVLYKTRETASQVEIKDREKRLKNLDAAFSVKNIESIKNKTIFLIDDVITTGATINEARRTLLSGGAKKVIGVTVAKG